MGYAPTAVDWGNLTIINCSMSHNEAYGEGGSLYADVNFVDPSGDDSMATILIFRTLTGAAAFVRCQTEL